MTFMHMKKSERLNDDIVGLMLRNQQKGEKDDEFSVYVGTRFEEYRALQKDWPFGIQGPSAISENNPTKW